MRRSSTLLATATLVASTVGTIAFSDVAGAASTSDNRAERYIVVLEDDVDSRSVANDHANRHAARVSHVYEHALGGYAATMSPQAAARVAEDSRVAFVELDGVASITHHRNGHDGGPGGDDGGTTDPPAQTLPTGVDRVDADQNAVAAIDGTDQRVDIDIAIIDTGIDEDHPDLNIAGGWNCVSLFSPGTCYDGLYEDGHGHGTHVAGTAAALDNGYGVVGMAPGARLWAVAVLDDNGRGYWSWVIGGIDKVAENAATIEIANMSLGGTGSNDALRQAIQGAVAKGVFFAVAAGNSATDVYGSDAALGGGDDFIPAAYPEVATISALADSDGTAGGSGNGTSYGPDDSFASFSNFSSSVAAGNPVASPGAAIDLLMPGVNIYSTDRYGGYRSMSGTSMASPHAAGLAALYMAENNVNPGDAAEVAAVRQALINEGVAQTGSDGLSTQNDPDGNLERLGWAASPFYNPAPVASFTFDCTELACDFDGTGSSDDNDITTYEWDFGDGATGLGATVSHTYTSAGTRTVTLTVTDDGGADGSTSQGVTVSEQPSGAISLTATGEKVKGRHHIHFTWSGTDRAGAVEITENGTPITLQSSSDDGSETYATNRVGGGTFTYQLCEAGTTNCSNEATVAF